MKEFFTTLQGRAIAALTIVALAMTIVMEMISIDTAYFNLRKARCDASISATEAQGKGQSLANFGRHTNVQQAFLDDCLPGAEDIKPVAETNETDHARAAIREIELKANKEREVGHYDKALELVKQLADASEALDKKRKGKPDTLTAAAFSNLSYSALFARDYNAALDAADRSISLMPDDLTPVTNRAHALMFLGRTDEAKAAYLAHRGEKLGDHDWNYYIADDFRQFRAAGLSHPFMTDIERELGLQAAAVTTPEPKKATQ